MSEVSAKTIVVDGDIGTELRTENMRGEVQPNATESDVSFMAAFMAAMEAAGGDFDKVPSDLSNVKTAIVRKDVA